MAVYSGTFGCQIERYKELERADCVSKQKSQVQKLELLSPSETIQLHVFLGKEAKEGAYKVDVTLATNEMKELEESAHCIYREGLALEEGAGISFGGYRALFSRFQPALDKEYTLYLRFH